MDRLSVKPAPQSLTVTLNVNGRPVARVLPIEHASAELIGSLRGRIRVTGDVLSTGVKWKAGG